MWLVPLLLLSVPAVDDKPRDPPAATAIKSGKGERSLRWRFKIEYDDEKDYLRQLHLLGAQLAFAKSGTSAKVRLVKDLSRSPAVVEEVAVKKIDLVFWREQQPEIVARVCKALAVDAPKPAVFYAFLPKPLEEKLAELELAHARKQNATANASDIEETHFQFTFNGTKATPRVTEQKMRK